MIKMKRKILLCCIVLLSSSALAFIESECQIDATNPFEYQEQQDVLLSEFDYISHQDINYGKLLKIKELVMMIQSVILPNESEWKSRSICPQGFYPFNQTDFTFVQNYINDESTQFKNLEGFQNQFSKLRIDDKQSKIVIFYNELENNYFTYCKQLVSKFEVHLQGFEGYDLLEGKQYEMTILNSNVEKVYIEDDQGQLYQEKTFNYTHKVNEMGFNRITMKFLLFGGEVAASCMTIWKQYQKNIYNSETSLTQETINTISLNNVQANGTNMIFFSHGSAPVSPLINEEDTLYVYYSDLENQLIVRKLSNTGIILGDSFNTEQIGKPFDIVSTPFGYIVLGKYEDDDIQRLWVSAYRDNNTLLWTRELVSFDKKYRVIKEQIQFFDSQCNLFQGMDTMTQALNGRLNYARGKVQIIFAHSNLFDIKENKQHCADSMISLDAYTGYDQQLFWHWGASHSLLQNVHYDGKYLYVASLSDTFPSNILFKRCDIDSYQCISNDNLVEGGFIGDITGKSSGRQGGFIDSSEDKNIKYFVFQRKAIQKEDLQNNEKNSQINSGQNELAILKFDSNLNLIEKKVIMSGVEAAKINAIKSIRYGSNILIGISKQPKQDQSKFNRNSIQKIDKSYLLLVEEKTLNEIQRIKLKDIQLSSNDDWQILSNGSIGFTYVHQPDGQLYYTSLEKLTIKEDYPEHIPQSHPTQGQLRFLSSCSKEIINNFNFKCTNQDDVNNPHRNLKLKIVIIQRNKPEFIKSNELPSSTEKQEIQIPQFNPKTPATKVNSTKLLINNPKDKVISTTEIPYSNLENENEIQNQFVNDNTNSTISSEILENTSSQPDIKELPSWDATEDNQPVVQEIEIEQTQKEEEILNQITEIIEENNPDKKQNRTENIVNPVNKETINNIPNDLQKHPKKIIPDTNDSSLPQPQNNQSDIISKPNQSDVNQPNEATTAKIPIEKNDVINQTIEIIQPDSKQNRTETITNHPNNQSEIVIQPEQPEIIEDNKFNNRTQIEEAPVINDKNKTQPQKNELDIINKADQPENNQPNPESSTGNTPFENDDIIEHKPDQKQNLTLPIDQNTILHNTIDDESQKQEIPVPEENIEINEPLSLSEQPEKINQTLQPNEIEGKESNSTQTIDVPQKPDITDPELKIEIEEPQSPNDQTEIVIQPEQPNETENNQSTTQEAEIEGKEKPLTDNEAQSPVNEEKTNNDGKRNENEKENPKIIIVPAQPQPPKEQQKITTQQEEPNNSEQIKKFSFFIPNSKLNKTETFEESDSQEKIALNDEEKEGIEYENKDIEYIIDIYNNNQTKPQDVSYFLPSNNLKEINVFSEFNNTFKQIQLNEEHLKNIVNNKNFTQGNSVLIVYVTPQANQTVLEKPQNDIITIDQTPLKNITTFIPIQIEVRNTPAIEINQENSILNQNISNPIILPTLPNNINNSDKQDQPKYITILYPFEFVISEKQINQAIDQIDNKLSETPLPTNNDLIVVYPENEKVDDTNKELRIMITDNNLKPINNQNNITSEFNDKQNITESDIEQLIILINSLQSLTCENKDPITQITEKKTALDLIQEITNTNSTNGNRIQQIIQSLVIPKQSQNSTKIISNKQQQQQEIQVNNDTINQEDLPLPIDETLNNQINEIKLFIHKNETDIQNPKINPQTGEQEIEYEDPDCDCGTPTQIQNGNPIPHIIEQKQTVVEQLIKKKDISKQGKYKQN